MTWNLDDMFVRLFLQPADNYLWAKEAMALPRLKDEHGRRCIYPDNHKADLERGYRLRGWHADREDVDHEFYLPLNPLKDTLRKVKRSSEERQTIAAKHGTCGAFRRQRVCDTFSKIKHHLVRRSHWLFMQYPTQIETLAGFFEENRVRFVNIWDFDVHVNPGDSEDRINQKYREMYRQIDDARRIATEYGFTIIFLTSPGDLVDGVHHQGRYGLVLFDEPVPVADLLSTRGQVKNLLRMDWETAWDTRNRNIRLLGQKHVVVCDPDTLEPLHRNDDARQRHERVAGAIRYVLDDDAVVPVRRIMELAEQTTPQVEDQVAPPVPAPVPVASMAPVWNGTPVSACPGLTSIERCQVVHDTFDVFTRRRKFGHRAAVKYLIDNPGMEREAFISSAIRDFKAEFVASRPSTSRTAANADQALRPYFGYYFDTFNRQKLNGESRCVKDHEDRERIKSSLGLDEKLVAHAARKYLGLTREETSWFASINRYLKRFNGRLFWGLLYGPGGIVPTRKWAAFKDKIKLAFEWIVDYQAPDGDRNGRCRQWSFTKGFIQLVQRLKKARERAREMATSLPTYKVVAVQPHRTIKPRGRYRCRLFENCDWIEPISLCQRDKLLKVAA